MATVSGVGADNLEHFSDALLATEAMRQLREMHADRALPEPSEVRVTRWRADTVRCAGQLRIRGVQCGVNAASSRIFSLIVIISFLSCSGLVATGVSRRLFVALCARHAHQCVDVRAIARAS